MDRGIALNVGLRLIALGVVTAAALFIFGGGVSPEGEPLPAFLLPATVVSAILITSATLVNQLFEGTMTSPLSDALLTAGVTSFLTILLYLRPDYLPEDLGRLSLIVLIIGSLLAMRGLVMARSEPGGSVLRAVTLLAAAVLVPVTISSEFLGLDLGDFREWACMGLLAIALLSLLSLLHRHSNFYVRAVGSLFAGGALIGTAAFGVLVLSFYHGALRPAVLDDLPDQLVLAEWIVLGLVIAACCAAMRSYLKKEGREAETGKWGKHIQMIQTFKPELEETTAAVNGFITEGRKEELLVLMTSVLLSNGAPGPEVSKVIQGIVRYSAPPVPLAFRWAYGNAEAAMRRDREVLVNEMLAGAASVLQAEYITRDLRGAGTAQGQV